MNENRYGSILNAEVKEFKTLVLAHECTRVQFFYVKVEAYAMYLEGVEYSRHTGNTIRLHNN